MYDIAAYDIAVYDIAAYDIAVYDIAELSNYDIAALIVQLPATC